MTVILLSCFSVIVDRKSMSNNIANLVKQAEVSELEASLTSEKSVYTLAENIRLNWKLTNKVNEDILLVSHYVTPQGNHYDNLQLRVIGEGQREPILIPLSTARYATAKIVCLLKPGKSLSHTLNLTDWLRLKNIELGSGHFDITATYQVTEKFLFGLNAATGEQGGKTWGGVALYPKYDFTSTFSLGARYESFSNKDGVTALIDGNGSGVSVNSFTITPTFTVADGHLLLKPEFRVDSFDKNFFVDGDGKDTKSQSTFTWAMIYKF